jgi:SAM-dependent methyltransferase
VGVWVIDSTLAPAADILHLGFRVRSGRHRCDDGDVTERARSFGPVAAAYEAFRPGYPEALVDAILDYAGRPVRTALEIGAGTGKATRVFASCGIAVTATDPDPAMLTELRKHVPAAVVTVPAGFEDLRLDSTFDLVFAAASLHWTRPEGRWARVASMLREGGVFAAFGGALELADTDVERAVADARSPYLSEDGFPSPDGTPPDAALQWPGTELARSDLFTDARQSVLERRLTMSARGYVDHLSTVSAYLQLPATDRERAFAEIVRVLPEVVELDADITLHLARKA